MVGALDAPLMPGRPLDGFRILSVALNLPGPASLMRLQAMGAVCTKLEPPARDGVSVDPMLAYAPRGYAAMHADIPVLYADLKSADGQAVLHAQLAQTDVLLTAFRPSALQRLGLDWETVHARHPSLCMVSIVGEAGAGAERSGHDLTYQASQGLVPDLQLPATALADMGGSLLTTEAVLQLLLQRARPGPGFGVGGHMDVALADAVAYLALPRAWGLMDTDSDIGGSHAGYRVYACADGRVAVAALERHFAERLCAATGLEAHDAARMREPFMEAHLQRYFAGMTCAALDALGATQDIPWHTMRD